MKIIKLGDFVRVSKRVKIPKYGWGNAHHSSVGYVVEIEPTGDIIINFPNVGYWKGMAKELVITNKFCYDQAQQPVPTKVLDSLPCWIGKAYEQDTYSILHSWGLDKNLVLYQLAADFYTLNSLALDFPEDTMVTILKNRVTNHLAEQFEHYLNMVIGGELRHALKLSSIAQKLPVEFEHNELAKVILGASYIYNQAGYTSIRSRENQWAIWKQIQEHYGVIPCLEFALHAFKDFTWRTSFGGHAWANITKTLLMYLKGETNKTIFVDTTFGLYHNVSSVFSKVWSTSSLMEILDWNLKGKMSHVRIYISGEVKNLYIKLHTKKGETKDVQPTTYQQPAGFAPVVFTTPWANTGNTTASNPVKVGTASISS